MFKANVIRGILATTQHGVQNTVGRLITIDISGLKLYLTSEF